VELENSFVVPAGIDAAWSTLLDIDGVAPCMPGATLTGRDGDSFTGTVKVKLGPVSMTYGGTGRFVETDEANHKAVIEANGKDSRGSSTARASVITRLVAEADDRTRVDVTTDLAITGRPAQFGRGVMQDVAGRIIDQFAANLAALMTAEPQSSADEAVGVEAPAAEEAEAAPAPASAPASAPTPAPAQVDDAIDLLGAAGAPVLKRLLPVLAVLLVVIVGWRVLRRSR
jgi:carbon monoxide dehydrogenase subunit G